MIDTTLGYVNAIFDVYIYVVHNKICYMSIFNHTTQIINIFEYLQMYVEMLNVHLKERLFKQLKS